MHFVHRGKVFSTCLPVPGGSPESRLQHRRCSLEAPCSPCDRIYDSPFSVFWPWYVENSVSELAVWPAVDSHVARGDVSLMAKDRAVTLASLVAGLQMARNQEGGGGAHGHPDECQRHGMTM